ncbi:hypothetical protein [uncultured Phenylobacterium sp.]|uniref:hypothetical protein n=1 Tax=uncultured Phenylobacterium sp. TaxID=349273 RepID=UPI0025F2C8DB|nr:hypothetical protein [uncultured Phenylobacterium sp.]
MNLDADIAADQMLGELAQLSLAVARDLQAKVAATEDTDALIRLAEAFTKVGRCVRMSVALGMRLRRGEPLVPAALDVAATAPDVEREETFVEERPERAERLDIYEPLFDRLPSGDLPSQIAVIARGLDRAAASLPEPQASAYRARCAAIAGGRRPFPLRPAQDRPPPDPRRSLLAGAAVIDLARRPPLRSG